MLIKNLLNVVILYNNLDEVAKYISDVNDQIFNGTMYISVVVNAYHGDKNQVEARIHNLGKNVRIYYPPENLGYLNGLLYGYKSIYEDIRVTFDWVVFSNTDITYENTSFYDQLSEEQIDQNVWCISPSVFNTHSKSYDNPEYINRVSKRQINRLIFVYSFPKIAKIYILLSHFKRGLVKSIKPLSQYIYSAKGCFFILHPDFVNVLLEMPYPYLLYSEESYIAELLIENGKKSLYLSNLLVEHHESTVTNTINFKKKCGYFVETLKYIRDRFY